MRSFSGLMVTCGLDHTLGPAEVPADTYNYPGRPTVRHGLHGRVSAIPARLSGYGERWEGDRCVLWAEGVVQQSTTFGEDLHLHRRIEADIGGLEIRVHDRVVNHGFARTPHMFFYHVNLGYPLLDEGARLLAPISEVVWAAHGGEAYRAPGGRLPDDAGAAHRLPRAGLAARDDRRPGGLGVRRAIVNDRLGLGFELRSRKEQLPCTYEWQNFQAGQYALGLEPSTHHVLGDVAARERGEMIWLEHDEARHYDAVLRVLDGEQAIEDAAARIVAAGPQPFEEYPEPSGRFRPLR